MVVVGDAVAPSAGSTRSEVECRVGGATKRIAVLGRRLVTSSPRGLLRIGEAEPFSRIPLTNANAYGGVDGRVPFPQPTNPIELMRLVAAHPGMYPRNPAGKGYIVLPDPPDGVELPNLEDPNDLLTSERLIVGSPDRWWQMPVPATLGFRDLAMFPRLLPVGCAPWFDAPEDERLAEVRRGVLPGNYRSNPELLTRDVFATSASFEMAFRALDAGTPISVRGVREKGGTVEVQVPAPPNATFEVDGATLPVARRSSRYVVQANDERLDVIHHLEADLPRAFIPGIHKYIALRLLVEGVGTIEYAPPSTIHDALVEAGYRRGALS